ncbi:AlbA family DNA-binding domain-containing protein [Mangrovibacterium diazotrophicum]|uniref:Putative DNA-binding protein n=1 Tax=Mangrovibacterium diazotrophicum TaxID=1261403 RepID=A0A419VVG2_9BACT|nr:ATP-binding protein [Mangrovibacterium diazotrophicum]RKD86101.1 putative DNA-binding protein [Mangrovibacterium diazotrophicum]
MSTKLKKMILEGEHQTQDFKYCISDSRKIARSLVAFANTDGGRLLIGVKDNGNIAGVRSEEEYYMIESAATIYSKPPIKFSSQQHFIDNKVVLEIIVESSTDKPHFAKDENDKWWAYYRLKDENKLANKVMIEVWKKQRSPEGIFINYSDDERFLLDYLSRNESISHSAFSRKARITYIDAEKILSDFIVLGILQPVFGEQQIRYALADDFDRESWDRQESA